MRLTNPTLHITFSEEPLSGNGSSQTIYNAHIINRSISIQEQLLNGLSSSSNHATMQLSRDCPSIADIIAADSDDVCESRWGIIHNTPAGVCRLGL